MGKPTSSEMSNSRIGASHTPSSSKSKSKSYDHSSLANKVQLTQINMKSFEASTVLGRPMLTKKVNQIMNGKGATQLRSTNELKSKGYVIEKKIDDHDYLYTAKGPGNDKMVAKLVSSKKCTPRFAKTLEMTSLKIIRWISMDKPCNAFIRYYDVFMVSRGSVVHSSLSSTHSSDPKCLLFFLGRM